MPISCVFRIGLFPSCLLQRRRPGWCLVVIRAEGVQLQSYSEINSIIQNHGISFFQTGCRAALLSGRGRTVTQLCCLGEGNAGVTGEEWGLHQCRGRDISKSPVWSVGRGAEGRSRASLGSGARGRLGTMRPPILTISPWTGGGANGSVAKSRHKPPAPGGKRPGEHRNVASCGWAKGTSRADRRRASNPGVKPVINGGASEPAGPPWGRPRLGGERRSPDSGSWSFTQSPSPGYLPPPPNVALAAQRPAGPPAPSSRGAEPDGAARAALAPHFRFPLPRSRKRWRWVAVSMEMEDGAQK